MGKKFYELVIEGPFLSIKGFIHGLRAGSGVAGAAWFSREEHIKAETLAEQLMEWTHLHETLCHLVVEEGLLGLIEAGVRNTTERLKLQVRSVKLVESASFAFHYEVFARHYGEEIKKVFNALPSELKLSADYQVKEEIDPSGKGLEAYAPCHEYRCQGRGSITGPIDAVVSFYRKVEEYGLIKKEPILLQLAAAD
jgi:hypothetical protein